MFDTTYVPAHAFIDHNMTVHWKGNSLGSYVANLRIEEMIEDYINEIVTEAIPAKKYSHEWDSKILTESIESTFNLSLPIDKWFEEEGVDDEEIIKRVEKYYKYFSDLKLLDYKVRILNTGTGATTRVLIESTDKTGKSWFTIGVSQNIIEASFKALIDSLEYKLFKEKAPANIHEK